MRISRLFGETLRETALDVDIASHQLLLRAGYIRQIAAGVFAYLPLAYRSIRKIEQILREEMDRIGGQEMSMPVVHPAELWQQTGRWQAIDETLVRFKDRRGRDMVLAMTHEEIVAFLAQSEIRSYRQLPQTVYQLQTKFRDEPRSRGGLIRTREFIMKDSYSLDRDEAGLKQQYIAHYDAYFRIFARVGLPAIAVRSDVGMMGGKVAHEFMYITPIGEDTLVLCDACGYFANREVARFQKEPFSTDTPQPVAKVHTPGTETIEALAGFLGVDKRQTAKIVFYAGDYGADTPAKLLMAVVRGDMDVNQVQVKNLSGANDIRSAQREEIMAIGAVPGFASPIGITRDNVVVIVDDLIATSPNLVAGANEAGYHLINTNYNRDYTADVVGHIAAAYEGAPCPECGQPLRLVRGVEVGNIFQLGTRYSSALGAVYNEENGEERPIIMGSYGIGVGRLLASLAEEHRDPQGLSLPISVAPYQVLLVSLVRSEQNNALAERLYGDLLAAGVEVLYDDRAVSAGIKFAEADLRGIPLRITISERSLKQGGVEFKRRTSQDAVVVPLDHAITSAQAEIQALYDELNTALASAASWDANETE